MKPQSFYWSLLFLICLIHTPITAQMMSRHLSEIKSNPIKEKGYQCLYLLDYQTFTEGISEGENSKNPLPIAVTQYYGLYWTWGLPEFIQYTQVKYPPNLPDEKWAIFGLNEKDFCAKFEVETGMLYGKYQAYFTGAMINFLFYNTSLKQDSLDNFGIYTIEGIVKQNRKIGTWKLSTPKNKTLLTWSYTEEGVINNPEKYKAPHSFQTRIFPSMYSKKGFYFPKEISPCYLVNKRTLCHPEGRYFSFYENGSLATKGQFVHHRKQGLWQYWNDKKQLLRTETWENGIMTNVQPSKMTNKITGVYNYTERGWGGSSKNLESLGGQTILRIDTDSTYTYSAFNYAEKQMNYMTKGTWRAKGDTVFFTPYRYPIKITPKQQKHLNEYLVEHSIQENLIILLVDIHDNPIANKEVRLMNSMGNIRREVSNGSGVIHFNAERSKRLRGQYLWVFLDKYRTIKLDVKKYLKYKQKKPIKLVTLSNYRQGVEFRLIKTAAGLRLDENLLPYNSLTSSFLKILEE